jgi:heat shock protein HslJ
VTKETTMTTSRLLLSLCIALSACASAPPGATIENTPWRLVALQGMPVEAADPQRAPHITLENKRVAGSGGCNRLAGSYVLDGERLAFGPLIGTKMACPQGMEQERAFLDALPGVKRWRIDGQRLDLLDEGGAALARFESGGSPAR